MTPLQLRSLRSLLGVSAKVLGRDVYLSEKNARRHINKLEAGTSPIDGPIKRALEAVAKDAGLVLKAGRWQRTLL